MNIRDVSTPVVQIDIDLRYLLTARSSKQVRGRTCAYSLVYLSTQWKQLEGKPGILFVEVIILLQF